MNVSFLGLTDFFSGLPLNMNLMDHCFLFNTIEFKLDCYDCFFVQIIWMPTSWVGQLLTPMVVVERSVFVLGHIYSIQYIDILIS